MFAKVSTILAVFAVAAQVAVATPPACLLAAVNTQSDPSDLKSVCTSGASQVQKYLSSNCGNNLEAATSAFADTCKSAGVTISSSSPTASSTGSASSQTSTHGLTSLPTVTLTNGAISLQTQTTDTGSAPSATESGSSSGAAQPSETAATQDGGAARLGMDIVGLAALGVAGLMLAM